jgi:toxin FitB
MIVLDTNVLSAMMRPDLNSAIISWLDQQDRDALRMTVISLHEIAYGLSMMPDGKRKDALSRTFDELQQGDIGIRMLLLPPVAATRAAIARAAAQKAAGDCDVPDALIAGIALAHGASVATRNVKDFQYFGVPLIDPWSGVSKSGA